MRYNFDEQHDRSNNQSIKFEFVKDLYGSDDVLPMWVADMDFKTAEPIIDALRDRLEQGIYGYTALNDAYYNSFVNWVSKRHDWQVKKEWLTYSPGVVPSLIFAVKALTEVGDKIIIQSPVYGPFKSSIENHGRILVNNPLIYQDGEYQMDFEDLEKKIDEGAKALILCNPHNPVGKVWAREDLEKLAEIVVRKDILLISDEIHSDLILKGHKHVPIASLSPEIACRTVTCMAPSKTFNLAGLQSSIVITCDEKIREKINNSFEIMDMKINNCFGQVAFEAAYTHGEEWLDQLLDYVEGNIDFVVDYIGKNIPEIKVKKPDGTYLLWFDCRALNMDHDALKTFMAEKAKVGMTSGDFFGQEGQGFMRYNVATTRENVKKGIYQIEAAIKEMR
ncbi:pyridoxal phosphate-dependent aminotransferase [Acidaminobacter sp. JC074]|uniref:MalY/PatB family protein n=1 Tax=Acidaminobacter sp. JC074 TaxID=2530199 RepID=UPI001F0DA5A6|nr:MalY/PatB family protein [Acidaminobacter sp. JC074]MCH4885943.1 pyridoxal phosphate-dependent aminotransferase [Acidaminobacter sp. JC074]